MTDEKTESAPERRRKRWRKTKWFYGILLTYVGVTIATMVWWSGYSHAKFDEAVGPIIARGEPLAWADFASDPIPDDQNAAILYKQAVNAPVMSGWYDKLHREFKGVIEFMEDSDFDLVEELATRRDLRQKHPKELRKLLGLVKDVLLLCRNARRRDKVDWGIDFSRKAEVDYILFWPEVKNFPYGSYNQIASLLYLAAIEAREAGRADEMIEYLRDIVALGDSLLTVPEEVSYLVAIDMHAGVNSLLEDVLPGIKIGDAPGYVRPEHLRGLIAELLDANRCIKWMTLVFMGERSRLYGLCRNVLNSDASVEKMELVFGGRREGCQNVLDSNDLVGPSFDFLFAPVFRLDAAWLVARHNAYVGVSRVGTLPELRRDMRQVRRYREGSPWIVKPLNFAFYMVSMEVEVDRTFEHHYVALTNRRMVATALAVRMYQADRGRLPDTLGDIVPDYIAEVPQDATAEPGTPIRYVNDPKRPRLYSVGKDGRDDGGACDDLDEDVYYRKEILFFLSGRPSVPKEESDGDASDDDDSD